jgi:hypothetical protein
MAVLRKLLKYVRFSWSAAGQMRGRWHRTCWRIHVFLWKIQDRYYKEKHRNFN